MAAEVATTTTVITTTETVVKTEEVVEEIKSNENHIDETKPQEPQEEDKAEIVEEPAKPEENGIAKSKVRLDLHPPWPKIVSPIPACLAVETYLRMLKIQYEISYKGTPDWSKLPTATYEGTTQRQDIYDFINAKFETDPDSHLSAEQKAVSRAFQLMVDESTAWSLVQYRWIDQYAETKKYYKSKSLLVPDVRTKMEKNKCSKCLEAHAIGKHTKEQIYSIAEKDLRSISTFLGPEKEYFMGDQPSAVDCTLFGLLANIVYAADLENAPQRKLIESDLTNLKDFCGRMKNDYWLDWDELCSDEVVETLKPKKSIRRKARTKSSTDTAKPDPGSGEKAEEQNEAQENGEKNAEGGENVEAAAEGEPAAAEANKEEEEAKEDAEEAKEEGEKNEDETPTTNGEEASEPPAQDAE